MTYPKVLVVTIGRINAADSENNGLLLRNLFVGWPRENLAQIYSGGGNGDEGAFGRYYRLGPGDRRFGGLFYRAKSATDTSQATEDRVREGDGETPQRSVSIKRFLRSLFVDTGIYELIFRPRLSPELVRWADEFKPDIIFAQGYSLIFAWLPVLLKARLRAKLAFLTTDDWPSYLYSGMLGGPEMFAPFMKQVVGKATRQLLKSVDIPFAFGFAMAEEYHKRYGNDFIVLSHSDEPERFEKSEPARSHSAGIFTILAIGNYNKFRWPLLLDVDECCRQLNEEGIRVRLAVYSYAIDPGGAPRIAKASFIDLFDDPGNERLPQYLKGADILLLAEGFDEGFVSAIRLSVSSKSHLFMFSHRPILVYAHPSTGVSRYAEHHHWARLVTQRDIPTLRDAIRDLLLDTTESARLVAQAEQTAMTFHRNRVNRERFFESLIASWRREE